MPRLYFDRTCLFQAVSHRCRGRARHSFSLFFAVLCVFLIGLAQSVSAAVTIYVYKNQNGALSFTSVPIDDRYTRVVRSEKTAETTARLAQSRPNNTVVQLFRDEETGDIGYSDGEKFIPLWPETYITLTGGNTDFASPTDYEDIWVDGLSEQVGPIKMRQGVPPAVIVTAIDWLIERNLDKYKPTISSQPNRSRSTFLIIVFAIGLCLLVIGIRRYYNKLATIPCRIRAAVGNDAPSNQCELLFLFISRHYNILARCSVRIIAAINKFGLDTCCLYCKERTENDTRICDDCQMRVQTVKINSSDYQRQEREQRARPDNEGGKERTDGKNGFDPYEVLRVRSGANKEEIKTAYLNLIKQYHPDRVSHLGREFRQLAEEKAQLINRAYEHLMAN